MRDPRERLRDILDAIAKIERYAARRPRGTRFVLAPSVNSGGQGYGG